ncbi:hypothetical protein EUGRSUZ_E04007 [Eucalyptus grandis]|uniref:Uncharacterized protein n=2 Tax=Eucalyptus grandis TaxID=71139 RepID=A0ACC3L2M1_EUCGR|nr:hypothetical protein EUGRSUZ_E04007 [Eucalyptus grandis]
MPSSMSPLLHFLFILIAAAASRGVLATATCDEFPRLCRVKNSRGPDCCRKTCTNTETDRLNCGMCGHKCQGQEICCKGYCVNIMFDKRNCGGCNRRCTKGGYCVYGMCDYA